MARDCKTCVYAKGRNCKILKEKIKSDCWAWADEAEAEQREKAIVDYSGQIHGNVPAKSKLPAERIERRTKTRKENEIKRGGKSVKEILDMYFYELSCLGRTDAEIAKELYLDRRRVSDYRKDRSTAMETVGSN